MNAYKVQKIVTACPHCFNTLKNEYPDLGGKYDVVHHTQLLKELLDNGRLTIEGGSFEGKKITFHDPCYLGRANDVYEAPRELIQKLDAELVEMKRSKPKAYVVEQEVLRCSKSQKKAIKTLILSVQKMLSK